MNNIDLYKDFPILKDGIVYLDSAATSLTPQQVLDSELNYYKTIRSNIGRSVHSLSLKATYEFELTKNVIAKFINCSQEEVIMTYGTTYGINMLFYSFMLDYIKSKDEVLTTKLEHHALLIPLQQLCLKNNSTLKFMPLNEDNSIDYDNLESMFSSSTKLVALTGMSNVTGYAPDIKRITKIAKKYNAKVLVDGAQLVPHKKVDVKDLDIDFLVFSGHKMLGPTGTGVLYIKKELINQVKPFMYGGGMIKNVSLLDSEFLQDSGKYEGGTPNIAGVIAFKEAINYLNNIGMDTVSSYIKELTNYTFLKASLLDYIQIYSKDDSGIFSFNIKGIHSHDVVSMLDSQNIATRSGYMCAMPLLNILGIKNCIRASFYIYNTKDDIDKLFIAIEKTYNFFNR